MSIPTTTAFVGAIGGTGTARLSSELAVALATDDRDVTILDAAFATQGPSDYILGALDPDTTALVADAADMPLESGLVALEIDAEGHAAICPAAALFERLVRTTTPDAVRVFEGRTAEAIDGFDHVLIDIPLPASNRTVAAAAVCDQVALVAPATDHGADIVDWLSARVADIDTSIDAIVSAFSALDDVDVVVPEAEATGLTDVLACREDTELVASVAAIAEVFLDIKIDAVAATDGVLGSVSEYVHH